MRPAAPPIEGKGEADVDGSQPGSRQKEKKPVWKAGGAPLLARLKCSVFDQNNYLGTLHFAEAHTSLIDRAFGQGCCHPRVARDCARTIQTSELASERLKCVE